MILTITVNILIQYSFSLISSDDPNNNTNGYDDGGDDDSNKNDIN